MQWIARRRLDDASCAESHPLGHGRWATWAARAYATAWHKGRAVVKGVRRAQPHRPNERVLQVLPRAGGGVLAQRWPVANEVRLGVCGTTRAERLPLKLATMAAAVAASGHGVRMSVGCSWVAPQSLARGKEEGPLVVAHGGHLTRRQQPREVEGCQKVAPALFDDGFKPGCRHSAEVARALPHAHALPEQAHTRQRAGVFLVRQQTTRRQPGRTQRTTRQAGDD
eukprot:scaffold144275_cov142-Phaeocystis_antarctica.AAC.1